MKRFRDMFFALVLFAGLLGQTASIRAQSDPRQILAAMIYQVSTGTVNPTWYGAELWQTIAVQTFNTGIYPQLRQLGVVQNVVMTQWQQLPGGMLYAMSVTHAYGVSYWAFGIGTYTNRIEYATFSSGPGAAPIVLPGTPSTSGQPTTKPAAPIGAAPSTPKPESKPDPTPGQDEACRKFPSLC